MSCIFSKIINGASTGQDPHYHNHAVPRYLLGLFVFLNFISNFACSSPYSRVDQDISAYDKSVAKIKADFASQTANPQNKDWVKNKIDNMVQIDQYMRKYWDTPFMNSYSTSEKEEFNKQFLLRSNSVDSQNTTDLKELLTIYSWFKISEFGQKTDNQAWLIVQHADQDHEFQESILTILDALWHRGETSPANYAYLYDRVASSFGDPNRKKLQRYGTQGHCIGPGQWEPWPIESPDKVDERRKSVGLNSIDEYKKMFKDICH
ncbi:MAG: DUF6624 domain-containing protein [Pseudobdellovibrionaceae bacterium]